MTTPVSRATLPNDIGRGAGNFLGQREVGMVLRLAKILRAEELRQTNNLRALPGCFAHPRDRFLEVGLRLGAALHLHECDSCSGGLKARPLLRIRYGRPSNSFLGLCHG